MVFIAEMLQKQVHSWKGRLVREWPRRAKKWKAVLWGLGGREERGLDPVSEKRLNVRTSKGIRLTLAW